MNHTTTDREPTSLTPVSLRRRIGEPLLRLVTQGHTPEKVALSVAFGLAIGVFPVFGVTTLLCVLVGVLLRLNHPALQIANQVMYLVQLPLIVVFIRIGESMLGAAPIAFSATLLMAELRAHPATAFERFGTAGLHGILGWAIVAPAVVALAYAGTLPILRLAASRTRARAAAQPAGSVCP
jgi:uncharacterized protein (DUF2062 family)